MNSKALAGMLRAGVQVNINSYQMCTRCYVSSTGRQSICACLDSQHLDLDDTSPIDYLSCRSCQSYQNRVQSTDMGNRQFVVDVFQFRLLDVHVSSVASRTMFLDRYRCTSLWNKRKFLYSAVSNPQDWSKRFTLYIPGRPVHSDTISTSLGSIQPYATINARRLLVHISTNVYSQVPVHTAEWTGAM